MKKTILSGVLIAVSSFGSYAQNNVSSLEFDGTSQFVNVPTSAVYDAINSQMTITAWINPSSISANYPRILNRSEGTGGGVDRWMFTWTPAANNYVLDFAIETPTSAEYLLGATEILLNEWTFASVVFDAGTISIYVNGQLDATSTVSFTDLQHVQGVPLDMAAVYGVNSFFPGLMDEITLWDTALDAAAIMQLMDCPPVGNESGLIGYWNFEEGTGTSVGDITANANDGTMWNDPSWSSEVPSFNCGVGVDEIPKSKKELVKIIDMMGREVKPVKNVALIYIYSDGTTERRFEMN